MGEILIDITDDETKQIYFPRKDAKNIIDQYVEESERGDRA